MDSNTLNGFEVFEDFMMPGSNVNSNRMPGNENEFEGASEELTDEELEELRKGNKGNKEEEEDVDDPKNKPSKKSKPEDNEEEEEEEEEDNESNDDPDNDIDNNQGEDIESNAVTSFFEALSDKMGWELDEDEEIPQTPEELVEYFKDVIEENSVPQYASEEVEALDNFVKNGGNLRDYFQIDGDLDLEEINIEDSEVNQKLVIKEFLKEKGFNAKQIEKKLTKYEEAGLLEDEATDALEALRDIKEQKKQELLEAQEKRAKELKKRQQEQFNTVVSELKGMDNIRGIKIPQKDKLALLEYIFKPTADGKTQYQKDYSKSVKNLLESAYFTMKGDTLLKAAKSEGSNAAINKFKNSLNRTGVSRKTKRQDNTSTESMWDSFARQLRVD
ncbi:regulatory protein [uncultured phage cr4_1]|uniref:Regulatory protein n=1 Tax=uncultured phage cr4_1 TaxID=2772084 RepID=A0A7M1RTZ5_9CAUD|nr:regulatory protein [uncultured phage cr4_1]QOR57169.1 regulatory protein [uncultured phage cr4_1]